MVQKAFLITAIVAFVLGGCGAKPPAQKETNNETGDFAKELKPPPGVPADAVLITGAPRLRQMLMGKRLQPVYPETEFDQGDEYFRSDKFWEKRLIRESSTLRSIIGLRIDWQDIDYCVYYAATRRCTSLWQSNNQRLFASHSYFDGKSTPPYEVVVTEFESERIADQNKGTNK